MTRLVFIVLIAAQALAAQGVLTGHVFDAAGGDQYLDDAGMILAVPLPGDASPFNEITGAEWQTAFTALSENRKPENPLGGALAPVTDVGDCFSAELQGDGTFRLEGIPFAQRIAVAVKIGDWWWPLREELWFTQAGAAIDVQIPYYRLGADPGAVRIESWQLEALGNMREDLKFGPITLVEALTVTNPDPHRAVMVSISLDILIAPGMSARSLPAMYGSQLFYMQGWNAAEPVSLGDANPASWTFGTGGGMHGSAPVAKAGAQASADNQHPLNTNPMLAMVGAGDTEYRVNPSAGGRSATLVFTRPVPPSREGAPGRLTLRLMHKGGVLMASPGDKLSFKRAFEYEVVEATGGVSEGLTFTAVIDGAHRRLYAPLDATGRLASNPDAEPDLPAGEVAILAVGFTPEVQEFMRGLEARAGGEPAPPGTPAPAGKQMDVSMIFKALAFLFGLAFVGALIATVRKPRDEQLKRLGELPGSRQEVLDAVNALEHEYGQGGLPARSYTEQRQRLLNRLVEFDSRSEN
ncbi:MAG: hypothetical protein K8I27_02120 [Planctomycetes bacterium]|nr:hypothetical protein [Planctomycetota bacterium]